MTRSKRVSVNLTPRIHERLKHLAESKGIPMTTLAALVIAEYTEEHIDQVD